MEDLSIAEWSTILFRADCLSLQATNTSVTDTCKYFFIHGAPINSCYIAKVEPFYDIQNEYLQQAITEYNLIKNSFGEDGIYSYIGEIACIRACGALNAERILQHLYRFAKGKKLQKAIQRYNIWKNNLSYKHVIKNDEGESVIAKCGKELAHVEKALGMRIESSLVESSKIDDRELEKNA